MKNFFSDVTYDIKWWLVTKKVTMVAGWEWLLLILLMFLLGWA